MQNAETAREEMNVLYQINDVVSELARELEVPFDSEDAEDEALNEVTHAIAKAFRVGPYRVALEGTVKYSVWVDDHETVVTPIDSQDVVDVPEDATYDFLEWVGVNNPTLDEIKTWLAAWPARVEAFVALDATEATPCRFEGGWCVAHSADYHYRGGDWESKVSR